MEKPTEQVADLSQIYSDLIEGENRSSKLNISPPNLCTKSAHISDDTGSPDEEKNKPSFCTRYFHPRWTRAAKKHKYNGQWSNIKLILFWGCLWFKHKSLARYGN